MADDTFLRDWVLKGERMAVSEPLDAWYFRVRNLTQDYEINVDPDLADADVLTTIINHRVFNFAGNNIGATGTGLTVDAVHHPIADDSRPPPLLQEPIHAITRDWPAVPSAPTFSRSAPPP